MPGLLDLSTELRLMILKDVFDQEDKRALTHPLLHVCRTTRLEYIDAFSGQFSLHVIGIPGHNYDKSLQSKCSNPVLSPLYKARIAELYINCDCDGASMHHSSKKGMDLFAFADSSFSWLIEHARSALIIPLYTELYYEHDDDSEIWNERCLNYNIIFKPEFKIEASYGSSSLEENHDMELRKKEDERAAIAQKELDDWKAGVVIAEGGKLVALSQSQATKQKKWLLTQEKSVKVFTNKMIARL